MNHYQTLGVPPAADHAAIKAAFRKIALECHPDKNPDPAAHERFKLASAAWETLGDAARRKAYDAQHAKPLKQHSRRHSEQTAHQRTGTAEARKFWESLFDSHISSKDARVEIPFRAAIMGGVIRVDGREFDFPAGIVSGQKVAAGGTTVVFTVKPHESFERAGRDIRSTAFVPFWMLVLGGRTAVETLWGKPIVTVPKGTQAGTVLRIKGHGIRQNSKMPLPFETSDHLVTIQPLVPTRLGKDGKKVFELLMELDMFPEEMR